MFMYLLTEKVSSRKKPCTYYKDRVKRGRTARKNLEADLCRIFHLFHQNIQQMFQFRFKLFLFSPMRSYLGSVAHIHFDSLKWKNQMLHFYRVSNISLCRSHKLKNIGKKSDWGTYLSRMFYCKIFSLINLFEFFLVLPFQKNHHMREESFKQTSKW